jgi:hypothetical protein
MQHNHQVLDVFKNLAGNSSSRCEEEFPVRNKPSFLTRYEGMMVCRYAFEEI